MTTAIIHPRRALPLLISALILAACSSEKPETMLASAQQFMEKKDHKAAIIQIKNALQANPNQPEARLMLGKALLESGDARGAEVELRKALEQQVSPDKVVPLLATALLRTGQAKKLVDDLAKSNVQSADAKADLMTSMAQAQAMLGKPDAADAALAEALAAKPDFEPARLVEARMKLARKDITAAGAIVESVLQRTPGNEDAWMLKGEMALTQNKMDDALTAFRKAIELRPASQGANAAAISLLLHQNRLDEAAQQLESLKKVAAKAPQTSFLEAQLAYQKKDFKLARDLIQVVLKQVPGHPAALQLAGAVEFQQKAWLPAESYLSKAIQAAPEMKMARRLLVSTYIRSGQPTRALATLQPVLDQIDGDPEMMALAGEVFLQNGDPKRAEEFLSKAAKLDPQDTRKRTSLALSHLAKGDTDAAFSELENIAATDKGNVADLALISAQLRRNQPDKALKAIDALEKKQADAPLPYFLRGQALYLKKDVAGARKAFEKALAVSPVYFPAAAALARLDINDKKIDDARKRFESITAADPKNMQALLAIAELKANNGGTPDEVSALINKAIQANPTDPSPRLALIDTLMRAGDPKKAVSAAQDAVAAISDNATLLDALGRTQHAAGDSNQALATYNKLATLQPASPQAHLRIAEIHLKAKNKDAATQSLKRALEIKPDLVVAQRSLIGLLLESGKTQEALAIARDVQKQRPQDIVGYILEGDVHASQKIWTGAINAYRQALKIAPSTEIPTRLHNALRAANQTEEADRFAAGWLKQQPKDVSFQLYLGDLASARKEYDKAASYFRGVVEAQPDNAVALNNLAWVGSQLKDAKALGYAEQANKLMPGQPAFMDTLATLLLEKGDTARAVELLRQAVKTQPEAAVIRLNLAKALLKSGDKPAAKKELDELAKLGDKFPAQAEVAQLAKGL